MIAYIYIAVAAVLWGIIGIFYRRLSIAGFSAMEIVTIRVSVAAVFMYFYFLVTDKEKLKIRWKDSLWFVGTGMCSLVFFNWCYFNAMEKSSLAIASVLLYTAPVFVLALSVLLFGEPLTWKNLCVLGCVVGGCTLVSGVHMGNSATVSIVGLIYGLGAGVGYALYSILGACLLKKYEPETVCAYTFLFAATGSVMLCGFDMGDVADICTQQVLPAALGIGVVCSMLPFLLYTKGLKTVSASRSSACATLEPVVAAGIGVICFQESLDGWKVCGILLILGGILFLGINQRHER